MSDHYDFNESVYDQEEEYGEDDVDVDERDDDLDRQLDAEDAMEALEEYAQEMQEEDNRQSNIQVTVQGSSSLEYLLQNLIQADTSGTASESAHAGWTIDSDTRTSHLLPGVTGLQNLLALLRGSAARNAAEAAGDDDEDEGDDEDYMYHPNSRSSQGKGKPDWWMTPHDKPQQAGRELLLSGEFGHIGQRIGLSNKFGRSKFFPDVLRERLSSTRALPKQDLAEHFVPNSPGAIVSTYPANVYCGQFSTDSSFYYVCCKDFNLHVYDMTAPRANALDSTRWNPSRQHRSNDGHSTTLKVLKSIQGIPEGWTITDSHLSPDNDRLIYSSMSPTVYMVKTLDGDTSQKPINFSDSRNRRGRHRWGDDDTYIWSCRFSASGDEVIAGGSSKIYVYDLAADRRTVKIHAHEDDINSCCWADSGSNVLISASDDSFIKIWDRRSLGQSGKPSGVLIGHTEGLTYVSAKGDGRYVISNGKDQALRLWDLRKMRSNDDYEKEKGNHYGLPGFDYRYSDSRPQSLPARPGDCSVMTYRGHMVMRTLIRCHFSPAETTGGAYIYSGSADGRVHIWSLDGTLVQVLDRTKTLPITFDPSAPDPPMSATQRKFQDCVRDVSWHSQEPILMSAAWGSTNHSSVAQHEWKGLAKMGGRLEDWVGKQNCEASESCGPRRSTRLRHLRPLPGRYSLDDDEDEDDEDYVPMS